MSAIMTVEDLRVSFATEDGVVKAVDGVSFDLATGEVLAIVGESGCGKSVTAQTLTGLTRASNARITGSVKYRGREINGLNDNQLRDVRGEQIAMVFQDPMCALNPVYRVGDQITEMIRAHRDVSKKEAQAKAIELLRSVGIPNPDRRVRLYPHEFSGGMRQRVMIAMALALEPEVLIADEPTTALDVTIQAQILDLMLELKDKLGSAIILITHDLGVVAQTCERVLVMYAGRMVEQATAGELFARPLHPYTRGLLRALPGLDEDERAGSGRPKLAEIAGIVPDLSRPIVGCAFAPRCSFVVDRCRAAAPRLEEAGASRSVACWEATRVAEAAA
jgi:oligopeptide/dipeptide ABC transporter ATP-binding protein